MLVITAPSMNRTSTCWPIWGFNAYRFSIEWARIEPEKGSFSGAEIEHYRRVLEACHRRVNPNPRGTVNFE